MSKTIEEIKAKRLLKDYIESKNNQIQELTDWKESAIKVFENLELQAIGKTLGIGLGEDVSTNVLPKIKELQEQNAELVNMLAMVIDGWGYEYEGSTAYKKVDELLTKYNHLKSNTNG